jgi:hypothetical protein
MASSRQEHLLRHLVATMLGEVFGDLRALAIKGGLLHGCEPYIR